MGLSRTALAFVCLATMMVSAGEASAQYYGGYDRRDGYERSERPQRGYDRGYDRGYERGRDDRRREGYGAYDGPRQGYGAPRPTPAYGRPNVAPNPMAGMSIEDQKRAIKNHRQMQKKAFKQGIIIP